MTTTPHADGAHCTLNPDTLAARLEQWRDVASRAVHRSRPEPGITVADYPNEPDLRARMDELIAAEAECCSFLRFALEEDGDLLRVTLSHPPDFALMPLE